ncbi:MAG: hypothetical protein V3W41_18135 [Planctomycetota bacterium]
MSSAGNRARFLAHITFLILASVFVGNHELRAQVWGFPLHVDNHADVVRTGELARVSVAIPEGLPIFHPQFDLCVVDDQGTRIASQAKVLSRWYGLRSNPSAQVKWVQFSFRADIDPLASRTYYLRYGAEEQAGIGIQELSGRLVIDTGAARFVIDTTEFSLIKRVEIGGVHVAGPGGLRVVDQNGALPNAVLTRSLVQEAGHLRAVIRQTGTIPSVGLAFTVRTTFVAGRSDCEVDFRLENPGHYGEVAGLGPNPEHAWFDTLQLTMPLVSAPQYVQGPDGTLPLGGSSFRLKQDWQAPAQSLNHLGGFFYEAHFNGNVILNGNRADGVLAIGDGTRAMAVSVDRFWENYPKAFSVDSGGMHIELWPDFGSGPSFGGQWATLSSPNLDPLADSCYRFEGGRHKTHLLKLDFRSGSAFTPSELVDMAARVATPLIGHADPESYCKIAAFGELVVAKRDWDKISNQRFERLCGCLARDDVADAVGSVPPVGFPAFRARGGTYGGEQMYGWQNYGDITWDDGYSSLHYGLPYSMLLNFFRTGDYSFFDIGRDSALHRRDYDQVHTLHPASVFRGGQSYEKGFHHGNFRGPTLSHTWVGGVLLHYIITGDEASYEASREIGEYVLRIGPENWDGLWGARIPGWSLEALVNLYNFLGDTRFLASAVGVVDAWNFQEAEAGSLGYVPNNGFAADPHAQSWMQAIMLGALGKYYLNFGDSAALTTMTRMSSWFVNDVIESRPTGPLTAKTAALVWRDLSPTTGVAVLSSHHVWTVSHALAYAGMALGARSLVEVSEDLWESKTRYPQISAGAPGPFDWTDPATFSPIAFKLNQFPTSESKAMGNMTLWGQAPMAARVFLDGAW